jgi:hypothetical protein
VGAKGMQANLATDHYPETNTKCSQIALSVNCIALSSSIFGTKLIELSVSIKEVPDLRPGTRAKLVKKLFCGSLRKGSDPSSNPSTKSGVFLHTCRHAVLIGPFKSTALGTNRRAKGVVKSAKAYKNKGFPFFPSHCATGIFVVFNTAGVV